jgi:N-acyl-D-amino-acid deacylase
MKPEAKFDCLIKNARVVDGTGAAGYDGWVGVRAGEIAAVGTGDSRREEANSRQVIDATGKVLCPGFIDMHSHGDASLAGRPFSPEKVWQGVTTQTIGHCGVSAAPASSAWRSLYDASLLAQPGQQGERWEGESFGEFMRFLGRRELGTNVAPLVGYAPVRAAVVGLSDRQPDRGELSRMAGLVEEAMQAGSFGFTTGLAYPPQCSATTEELAVLCEVVARYGGLYATHVRDIIYDILSGVREAIEIGRRTGVHVHIAHLQVRPNPFYTLRDVLELLDAARREGLEVTCDQYAYLAGQGPLTPLFPAWSLGGGPEAIRARLGSREDRRRIKEYMREIVEKYFRWSDIILWALPDKTLQGRSIQTVAHLAEKDPREVVLDLVEQHGISIAAIYFGKTEQDLREAAAWPFSVVGSDGLLFASRLENHPRTFGTFPRYLRKYVREQQLFTLEEAVRRMSGLTAEILKLSDRGLIAEGRKADLLLIDPRQITDTATYEEPDLPPRGIELVMVNGKIVRSGGEDHPTAAGQVLAMPALRQGDSR